jgi:hypothetical protein
MSFSMIHILNNPFTRFAGEPEGAARRGAAGLFVEGRTMVLPRSA